MEYASLVQAINGSGLRMVMVPGVPSPWSQAAKTFFELKQVPCLFAAQEPGGTNEELVAWSGQKGGPVVAYNDEAPRHHWLDILYLAERLSSEPSLIPKDATERALMLGLSHEICGELGIGWCRRLIMFEPAMSSGNPPEGIARMADTYRYNPADTAAAPARVADILGALSEQLRSQKARGSRFLVGDTLSALDIYWAAFANLLDPLPDALCPIPADWRPGFVNQDPAIATALNGALLEHRDFVCEEYFRLPMEF